MSKDELMTVELSNEMKAAISSIVASKNVSNDMNIQIGKNNFNGRYGWLNSIY